MLLLLPLTELTARGRRSDITNQQLSTVVEEAQGPVKAQRRVSRKASWRRWHLSRALLEE